MLEGFQPIIQKLRMTMQARTLEGLRGSEMTLLHLTRFRVHACHEESALQNNTAGGNEAGAQHAASLGEAAFNKLWEIEEMSSLHCECFPRHSYFSFWATYSSCV